MRNWVSITPSGFINFSKGARQSFDLDQFPFAKVLIDHALKITISLSSKPKAGFKAILPSGVYAKKELRAAGAHEDIRGRHRFDFCSKSLTISFSPKRNSAKPESSSRKRELEDPDRFTLGCGICRKPTKATYNGFTFSWVCMDCRQKSSTTHNCHFCGGGTRLADFDADKWWVHCYHCGARGPLKQDRAEAVSAWNVGGKA